MPPPSLQDRLISSRACSYPSAPAATSSRPLMRPLATARYPISSPSSAPQRTSDTLTSHGQVPCRDRAPRAADDAEYPTDAHLADDVDERVRLMSRGRASNGWDREVTYVKRAGKPPNESILELVNDK